MRSTGPFKGRDSNLMRSQIGKASIIENSTSLRSWRLTRVNLCHNHACDVSHVPLSRDTTTLRM